MKLFAYRTVGLQFFNQKFENVSFGSLGINPTKIILKCHCHHFWTIGFNLLL